MRGIKQTLTERYYSWRDAEQLAEKDPEFDLSGNGPVWTPVDFVEEDLNEETTQELQEEYEASQESEERHRLQPEDGKPEKTTQPTA